VRTMEEMLQSALTLRNQLLQESKDPTEGIFTVTAEEHALMKMQPLQTVTLSHERDRFCGLKVHVV
jgi:hypothetical protein